MAEEALGIPSRSVSHELPRVKDEQEAIWEFGVHEHEAKQRGHHFDLRLGDPKSGQAHSWAMAPVWPKPGESTWAIQQPTHTVEYMDFAGEIPEGYGAGTVKLKDRDKVEVLRSAPGHITFHRYTGEGPEEYTLHRVGGKKWKLFNRTFTRKKMDIPTDKPTYREEHPAAAKVDDPAILMSAKIDDAHNLFLFPPKDRVRVVSYREGVKRGLIEHTHKVPSLQPDVRTPPGLEDTVLRGGLYAMDPATGRATPAETVGGMLNSNVWKSRIKQGESGLLRAVLYDVSRFRGEDMTKAPYRDKLQVLEEVRKKLPGVFELPPMAVSHEEKKDFLDRIRRGDIPQTVEGAVLWNLDKGVPPVKLKFTKEHDVYIRGFFAGKGKYAKDAVGGFLYSHTPTGPVVGRVGTGLSDTLRRDMFENPEKYDRIVAKVKAPKIFESGALGGSPVFLGFHLDKNDQDRLDQLA